MQLREHERVIRGVLRRYWPRATEAEIAEAVQDVYERVLTDNPPQGDDGRTLARSYTIARNLAIDRRRRQECVPMQNAPDFAALAELAGADESQHLERIVESQQELDLLLALVEQLEPLARRIFTLHAESDMKPAQIAAKLGIKERKVRSVLANALDGLTTELEAAAQPRGKKP